MTDKTEDGWVERFRKVYTATFGGVGSGSTYMTMPDGYLDDADEWDIDIEAVIKDIEEMDPTYRQCVFCEEGVNVEVNSYENHLRERHGLEP